MVIYTDTSSHPIFTPHQLTKHVKLLHKIAVLINGKILILKRSEQAHSRPGKWDLAGGNSEWPVDAPGNLRNFYRQDVARELVEETGLKVKPEIFDLQRLIHFSTFYEKEKEVFTMIYGWLVSEADLLQSNGINLDAKTHKSSNDPKIKVQISDEHSDYHWLAKTDLAKYDFGGDKAKFLIDTINNAFNS